MIKVGDSVSYSAGVLTAVGFVITVAVVADFLILPALATAIPIVQESVIRDFPHFIPLQRTPLPPPPPMMMNCHEPILNLVQRQVCVQVR
jgi:hypothetical protein